MKSKLLSETVPREAPDFVEAGTAKPQSTELAPQTFRLPQRLITTWCGPENPERCRGWIERGMKMRGVAIKPSELSSLQTMVLIEALHEANLPKGLLNVVTGLGNVVGAELVRNPDVAKISFTGSAAVGEKIMSDGAQTMKRVTLELGASRPPLFWTMPLSTRRFRRL
jgi:hypothetical protein